MSDLQPEDRQTESVSALPAIAAGGLDGADRPVRGVSLRDARQLDPERRAAHDRPRPARVDDRAAVGDGRLHRRVRRVDAVVRCRRRPIRPAAADAHRAEPAGHREPLHRVRHHGGATDRRPSVDGCGGGDDDSRVDGAGLPAVRHREPARPLDHPDLHRRPGRARHRPDRRWPGARSRSLAGPAAGQCADRRARDHRHPRGHRCGQRGRAAPRPGRRHRGGAGDRDDRPRPAGPDVLRERGRRLLVAMGGHRRRRRDGDPVRPAREVRALSTARSRPHRPPPGLQRPGVQSRRRTRDRRARAIW